MTVVSNDSSWWPIISSAQLNSYLIVAASAVVIYDWVMTFAQEVELIWRQRLSLMTVLYLSVRYIGILYAVAWVLATLPTVSQTDAVSNIIVKALNWTNVVTAAMLGAIIVTRLYAMYQGSRKILLFLIVIFLAINIACGVLAGIAMKYIRS
ncbi:hypothetical protein BDR03DRAFT_89173 [Suillus americanus]|nr:hypothetical protein BDR03DRAFT_89173 [Suillus americanus]